METTGSGLKRERERPEGKMCGKMMQSAVCSEFSDFAKLGHEGKLDCGQQLIASRSSTRRWRTVMASLKSDSWISSAHTSSSVAHVTCSASDVAERLSKLNIRMHAGFCPESKPLDACASWTRTSESSMRKSFLVLEPALVTDEGVPPGEFFSEKKKSLW